MTEINWPDGWTPHADRDASEPSMRERAERAESVARGQQKLIEAQRAEVERLQATLDGLRQLRVEDYAALAETSDERNDAEAEVARLRAEIADRESERADLRDRVEKAEAAVGRVEILASAWEGPPNGSEWGVPRMIRAALRGDQ